MASLYDIIVKGVKGDPKATYMPYYKAKDGTEFMIRTASREGQKALRELAQSYEFVDDLPPAKGGLDDLYKGFKETGKQAGRGLAITGAVASVLDELIKIKNLPVNQSLTAQEKEQYIKEYNDKLRATAEQLLYDQGIQPNQNNTLEYMAGINNDPYGFVGQVQQKQKDHWSGITSNPYRGLFESNESRQESMQAPDNESNPEILSGGGYYVPVEQTPVPVAKKEESKVLYSQDEINAAYDHAKNVLKRQYALIAPERLGTVNNQSQEVADIAFRFLRNKKATGEYGGGYKNTTQASAVKETSVNKPSDKQAAINYYYKEAASDLGIKDNWWKDQRVADLAFSRMKENGLI